MGALNQYVQVVHPDQRLTHDLKIKKSAAVSHSHCYNAVRAKDTVGKLLKSLETVPSRSILLGQCLDQLPFLVNLGDPELGGILVGCQAGYGKTHQLQVMVDSAVRLHSPREIQALIFTFHPEEWRFMQDNVHRKRYLQGIYDWYHDQTESVVEEITRLAEDRRRGGVQGPDVLLILDDLHFIEDLSFEAQINLHWLLEYGAQSGIWILGAINTYYATRFQYWTNAFRTRIIGRMNSTQAMKTLAVHPESVKWDLGPGNFQIWTGDAWLRYSLPLLGD